MEITIYTDAKASKDRFALVNINKKPIWFGRFFEPNEQWTAELESAKKAVWLAGKVKEHFNEEVKLNLITDAEWLCYQKKKKKKGYVLTYLANKYGVGLNVSWISGQENPADAFTICSGFQKYTDYSFDNFKIQQTSTND